MMKVALCYPPTQAVTVMPPLGIGYLASVSQAAGFRTDIYDLARRQLPPRQLPDKLASKSYDVIGLSVSTPNYNPALDLARRIRKACPRAHLVLGGPHPSAFPERTLRDFDADTLIEKEAEQAFPAFLAALGRNENPVGKVDGVFALRDDTLVGRPAGAPPQDLDAIPWPAWEKLTPHRYPPIPHQLFVRKLPVAPILTSRGCPMECSFCTTSYLFGKTVRTRTPARVVEEMIYLRDRFGIREIHFEDDNLTLNRNHAMTLFQQILDQRLGVLTKFPNGLMVSTLDEELLALMARAGCYQISIGIETTSAETIDKERKYLPYEQVRNTVAIAKKIGLEVQGLFVVGLPYDSEQGLRKTVRDAIDMGLDLAHFGLFVPLPGSNSADHLAGCDIQTLNFFTPYVDFLHITPKKLKSMQRWAILKFYLRPRPMLKLLSMFKLRQLAGVLTIVRRYILGL